jgi:hypothetical protein
MAASANNAGPDPNGMPLETPERNVEIPIIRQASETGPSEPSNGQDYGQESQDAKDGDLNESFPESFVK